PSASFCLTPPAAVFFFFFFQAEDGIRDLYVTGVQTCALPIFGIPCTTRTLMLKPVIAGLYYGGVDHFIAPDGRPMVTGIRKGPRSEERRVGKECRSRWSP